MAATIHWLVHLHIILYYYNNQYITTSRLTTLVLPGLQAMYVPFGVAT
jgi:hypothetical protein